MAERRELLSKAWEESEKDENKPESGGEEKAEVSAGAEKPEEGSVQTAQEEQPVVGADKKEQKAEKTPKEVSADNVEKKAAVTPPKQEVPPAVAPVTDKAPNSWKAELKTQWSKLPADVRTEIRRRESEIERAMSEAGQVKRFAQEFAQTVQPFQHLIRAQNSTPMQAVRNLMTTAAGLAQGTTEQKAKIVAEIISNYGVDIRTLDTILSASPQSAYSPQQNTNSLPPQFMQALNPIYTFMDSIQQARQERQEQMQREAAEEIAKHESLPYFDDLRDDIADLMDMARQRGRTMTIKQAYDQAVKLNPEIEKVVNQQQAAARNPVSEAAATLARARKAASTVSGAPANANVGAGKKPTTRRETLMQAWEDQG